jgi:uncharacterized protein YeeX (DUF496 family)
MKLQVQSFAIALCFNLAFSRSIPMGHVDTAQLKSQADIAHSQQTIMAQQQMEVDMIKSKASPSALELKRLEEIKTSLARKVPGQRKTLGGIREMLDRTLFEENMECRGVQTCLNKAWNDYEDRIDELEGAEGALKNVKVS